MLRCVTSHMGRQIQNSKLVILRVIRNIQLRDMNLGPSIENMHTFLGTNLDTNKMPKIIWKDDDAWEVLRLLRTLENENYSLVEDYAFDAYSRAYKHDTYAIPSNIELSLTERHRISRGFWRLKLYGVLFYNYADCFDLALNDAYSVFLDRLCDFELDEMVTLYQWMVRQRCYFNSEYPHIGCLYTGERMGRNRDPFECPDCQGRVVCFSTNRSQAFWRIVEDRYLTSNAVGHGVWADSRICRQTPLKTWHDFQESNAPNEGWKVFRNHWYAGAMNAPLYACIYRNWGYCFWDWKRLDELGCFEVWESQFPLTFL